MTTVAITGGTGFIGRHLIAALAASGQSLRLLVRNPSKLAAADRQRIVPGSLSDGEALARLVDQADTVIHCAGAISASGRSAFPRFFRAALPLAAAGGGLGLSLGTKACSGGASITAPWAKLARGGLTCLPRAPSSEKAPWQSVRALG